MSEGQSQVKRRRLDVAPSFPVDVLWCILRHLERPNEAWRVGSLLCRATLRQRDYYMCCVRLRVLQSNILGGFPNCSDKVFEQHWRFAVFYNCPCAPIPIVKSRTIPVGIWSVWVVGGAATAELQGSLGHNADSDYVSVFWNPTRSNRTSNWAQIKILVKSRPP